MILIITDSHYKERGKGMKSRSKNSDGISEVVSVILVIALMLVLAMVVYALIFGNISLKQTSRVAATAGTIDLPLDAGTSTQILYAMPSAGERYYLKGQSNIPSNYPVVSFMLKDPQGNSYQTTGQYSTSSPNQYGKSLFIYRDTGLNFRVTDSLQAIKSAPQRIKPISPHGEWTIIMIDNTANVPLTEMKVRLGAGSVSLFNPLAALMTWTNTGEYVNSSGYKIPFTNYGVNTIAGPGSLKAYSFNGTGAYIQGSDNPDVTFTGDMGISFWMQPTASGVNSYHEILGKGSNGDLNDNYDLFIIDQKLWFEWTDEGSGQMYHIMTNNNMAWGSPPSWNYATFTVNSGTPKIYFAGVEQPISYYSGNTIGTSPLADPVVVNLKADTNPITIGKQNYIGNEMYYQGNMSEVAYYNRALSETEIINNKNNFII